MKGSLFLCYGKLWSISVIFYEQLAELTGKSLWEVQRIFLQKGSLAAGGATIADLPKTQPDYLHTGISICEK